MIIITTSSNMASKDRNTLLSPLCGMLYNGYFVDASTELYRLIQEEKIVLTKNDLFELYSLLGHSALDGSDKYGFKFKIIIEHMFTLASLSDANTSDSHGYPHSREPRTSLDQQYTEFCKICNES